MKLSVLICTRNRATPLAASLARFFEQKFSGEYEYELLVIDNNSTDGTRATIEEFAARHPEQVRYVHEPLVRMEQESLRPRLVRARGDVALAAQAASDGIVAENRDRCVVAQDVHEAWRRHDRDRERELRRSAGVRSRHAVHGPRLGIRRGP